MQAHTGTSAPAHTEPDYRALAALWEGLDELQRFSERVSREHGCTASMFGLLLAVQTARRGAGGPDIGMLATAMRVRHPSAAEMVRKAEARGFLELDADPDDGRRVLVSLSDVGEKVLDTIAREQVAEIARLRSGFTAALQAIA